MSAVGNIVLFDALATPVEHTFIPIGPDSNGVWWWEDQSSNSSIGFNRISAVLVRAQNPAPGSNAGSRINRVKVGLHTPTLETLSNNSAGLTPPPTVAYIDRANMEFILPDRSNVQERKTLRKFAVGILNESQISNMIEVLQNAY